MSLGTFLGNRTALPNSFRSLAARALSPESSRNFSISVLLALAYSVAGKFGQQIAGHGTDVTLFWPPTGISLAALLLFGYRFWPAIFLGAFFVNVTSTHDIFVSLGVATGNTLEALIGVYLVRRYAQGTKAFFRAMDVVRYVLFVGVLATALSATIGASVLCSAGYWNSRDFLSAWLIWWAGDAIAALVLTPFLVLLFGNDHPSLHWLELAELLVLLIGLVTISVFIFGPPSFDSPNSGALVVLCIPFSIWAAYRFCPLEAAGANLVLCGFVIWTTITGHGPFASTKGTPLLLGLFVASTALTTLVISAFRFQWRSLEEALTVSVVLEKSEKDKLAASLSDTSELLDVELAKNIVVQRDLERHRQLVNEMVQEPPRIIWVIDTAGRSVHYVDPLFRGALNHFWERLCSNPNTHVELLPMTIDAGASGGHSPIASFTNEGVSEKHCRVVGPDGARTRAHQVTYPSSDCPGTFESVSIEVNETVQFTETQESLADSISDRANYALRDERFYLGRNSGEHSGD